jgi:homoserine O-acetyltransferase
MTVETRTAEGKPAFSVASRSVTFFEEEGGLLLESGAEISPVTVAFETYGELSEAGDNAILVCHALSGDAHAAGDPGGNGGARPGWWADFIGPGRALDTDRFFIISSNFLGSCYGTTGPTSIDGRTGKAYGKDFPQVTIGDMVEVQRMLVDHLGIGRLLAVIGGSMGGQQVLEWAVRFPDRLRGAIPIATTSRLSAQGIAFNETGRVAITGDAEWKGGDYHPGDGPGTGLALARMIGHITYLSEESMDRKFGRRFLEETGRAGRGGGGFQVEGYLHSQGSKFVRRFDANTYLTLTRAMDRFDLAAEYGTLEGAFSRCRSSFLVLSFTSDWLFPPAQSREMVAAMKRSGLKVAYCNLESDQGHDAFLLPGNRLGAVVKGYLNRISEEDQT